MNPFVSGYRNRFRSLLTALALGVVSTGSFAQQDPDTLFSYPVGNPGWPTGQGPLVLIDEGHHNFHTKGGGFQAFSRLLASDGCRVDGYGHPFARKYFPADCKILVIANALDSSDTSGWVLPDPSAFSPTEIRFIEKWVREGGSLFLIADHMPFAGAAAQLAAAFGFGFVNGFAYSGPQSWPPSVFSTGDGTLLRSPVTMGLSPDERVDTVATFSGSAFRIPDGATGILRFPRGSYSLQPDTAWAFHDLTPRMDIEGWYQGAVARHGKGRIAVFGEAAMFTAQIVNGNFKVGFNSPEAPSNARFLLNLIHWLDTPPNPFGLDLIITRSQYESSVAGNPAMQMVDLARAIPGIDLDIRYATANNFAGSIIYTAPRAFLRKPVAMALARVQDSLRSLGLGLRIYDAYRPYSATLRFYQVYPDTTFVANPRYGSRHNRGCAVDVTLINLETGREIPMPTVFDDFSPKAMPDYADLPGNVLANRKMLFELMAHFGFHHISTEWWHFDFQGWADFPLLDIPFKILEKEQD
jgi:D-alanyl-D-alanine dipeptidase